MSPDDSMESFNDILPSNVSIAAGTLLKDRYRIEGILGEGGMGRVYRAVDIESSCKVAVKQLILQMDSDNSEVIERFRREYHFLNSIDHPNLVKAHDLFSCDGQVFLVMEFIVGISLKQLIEERPRSLSLLEQIAIGNQAARAIEVLNTAGVLHRDLKPGNIMLDCETGRVTLLDLGLGKAVGKEDWALTQKGAVIGTLEYLSPEQANGKVSAQSDVFSLGITLYQFFLWEHSSPFKSHGGVATIMEITTKDLPPLLEQMEDNSRKKKFELSKVKRNAYAQLSEILLGALEKEPAKRPSAGQIADDLEKIHKKLAESSARKTSMENTSWDITMQVDVRQMEQLKKLGEKYGRDRVSSRRPSRRSKRTARRVQHDIKLAIAPSLYVLAGILTLVLLVLITWVYNILDSKNKKLTQISKKLREVEANRDEFSEKFKVLEAKREKEFAKFQGLHENLITAAEYSNWGRLYGKCADVYRDMGRYEQALRAYRDAVGHSNDSRLKASYKEEIYKLQKKIASRSN